MAERHADLARGWTRQELAKRDQAGVVALAQPAASLDELLAEVAQVSDRPAEGHAALLQESEKDLPRAPIASTTHDLDHSPLRSKAFSYKGSP